MREFATLNKQVLELHVEHLHPEEIKATHSWHGMSVAVREATLPCPHVAGWPRVDFAICQAAPHEHDAEDFHVHWQ
jgi:hypothetical protein